ncbi:amino acid transporter [Algimonas ampicilliniresistens]|uniref:Amino acid transporter n=1 Tax=Algimonas ampicilliniresistens TaxID=1298735 RepID=A0ABQ5VB02_9PROT|nr:amino acid permease [Algimonas ampicilliniresistens]GLQ23766.1 amino acid transporter [Algimonas ampicilliniresistens]
MNTHAEATPGGAEAGPKKLDKNLKLFDVYAMSTGAMFSSGLFLLPGIAAAATGNSVFLAYFFAGFLILPAMYCMAELSTAMPKAGGTYYFLDRAMGPLMGTIGGLGSWVAVVFKSAFALVGMGAYLGLYLDLPFEITAIILAIAFGAVNIAGAKETTKLQRVLVTTLVAILVGFTLLGLKAALEKNGSLIVFDPAYGDFFKGGLVGFVSTIGLVFVSYAGLTKVASVAEEVENPDRNIPLGMTLSLLTATVLYTLGTVVLIKILPGEELFGSLTPIADAGRVFMGDWPFDIGVILIVIAAIAAFASTGNAGIMSASRYPYAMAKDKLVPEKLAELGKFKTPTFSILLTVAVMIVVIIIFDVASVAKLASAFQLLLFMLVCAAVMVMRESRIPTYKPGFKVPLYPWMPIAGILISFWLIIEMGTMAIAFTGMMVIACVVWYNTYASRRVERRGAIFHVHERLGRNAYEGLEHELMTIINDRTQAENLSYEAVIARSLVTDFRYGRYDFDQLVDLMAVEGEARYKIEPEQTRAVIATTPPIFRPISDGVRLTRYVDSRVTEPELFIFRFGPKARLEMELDNADDVHTLMVLLCPAKPAGLDMRIGGHLAEIVQGEGFERRWLSARSEAELNDVLVRDDHFLHVPIADLPRLKAQVGRPVGDLAGLGDVVVALIERGDKTMIATSDNVLMDGDVVALVGEPSDLMTLRGASAQLPEEEE